MDHQGATGPSVPARWWGPTTTVANADVVRIHFSSYNNYTRHIIYFMIMMETAESTFL